MPTYHGSCHCGRVRFEVDARPTALSECNCSICSAKAALYMPVKEIVGFRITAGESELTGYRFNTMTAVHYLLPALRHTYFPPAPARSEPLERRRPVSREDLDIASVPIRRIDGRNREATAKILEPHKRHEGEGE